MSEVKDAYRPLKYMAYCMSQLPPEGIEATYADFVNYAKFQLSVKKNVLMEDPVWEKYTDEAILVEYYANIFSDSKEERQKFESSITTADDDFSTWADKMIEKNQEELNEKAAKLEESISFKPESLGE